VVLLIFPPALPDDREVGQRLVRLRALARLGEMADRGDFDEFLDGKSVYRK
jgi:hypothetical protein